MNIAEILKKFMSEDGTFDQVGAENELKTEIAKEYAPKHDFNNKIDALKVANDMIEKLQKDNKSNEALQTEIDDYKDRAEKAEADFAKYQLTKEAEDALREKGVTNVKFALFEMGELERDDSGAIKDFDTKFKSFSEANPDFIKTEEVEKSPAEPPKPNFFGSNPAGEPGVDNPNPVSYGAQFGKAAAEQMKNTGGI